MYSEWTQEGAESASCVPCPFLKVTMQNKRKSEAQIIALVTAAQAVPMVAAPLPADDLLSDADDAEVEAAAMLKEARLNKKKRLDVKNRRGKGQDRDNDLAWSPPSHDLKEVDMNDPNESWRQYEHPVSGKNCQIPQFRSHNRDSVRRVVKKKRFHAVMTRIAQKFSLVGMWTECHRVTWYLHANNKVGEKAMDLMTNEKKQALLSVMPGNVVLSHVAPGTQDMDPDDESELEMKPVIPFFLLDVMFPHVHV
jgi:hypothetical protein